MCCFTGCLKTMRDASLSFRKQKGFGEAQGGFGNEAMVVFFRTPVNVGFSKVK